MPEVQVMAQTFKNFEAYKRNSPEPERESLSKVNFEKFKQTVLSDKRLYDTNINSRISFENKILACKNREQTNRALALSKNIQQ